MVASALASSSSCTHSVWLKLAASSSGKVSCSGQRALTSALPGLTSSAMQSRLVRVRVRVRVRVEDES
jgi:hypothetical protein